MDIIVCIIQVLNNNIMNTRTVHNLISILNEVYFIRKESRKKGSCQVQEQETFKISSIVNINLSNDL